MQFLLGGELDRKARERAAERLALPAADEDDVGGPLAMSWRLSR